MTEEKQFSLTALIDKWVEDSREEKVYESWRASSIGGCPRSHFYRRLGIKPTTPPNKTSLRKFAVGDTFHKLIQDVATAQQLGKEVGSYAVEVEQEVYDKELDLGGRYDLLVHKDGKRILFDIKTVHSQAFWRLEKSGGTVKDQWPHYWKQLGAYMLMLKNAGTPVDEGRILLVSKDDLVTKEVSYLLTPELEQSVRDEVGMLNDHWEKQSLLPCTCEGWKREYCSYGVDTGTKKVVECCPEELYDNFKKGSDKDVTDQDKA